MAGFNYTSSAGAAANAPDSNATEAVEIIGVASGGNTLHFAVTSSRGSGTAAENGVAVYLIDETVAGTATIGTVATDTLSEADVNTAVSDVVDLSSVTVGGQTYVFSLSNADNSIQAMSVDDTGAITNLGTIDLASVSGNSTLDPNSMDLIEQNGQIYLVTAGTDRLHAVQFDPTLGASGQFVNATFDQELASSFTSGYWGYTNGATDPNSFVETETIGGVNFVIAGGGDGNSGLDLFTFDAGGGGMTQRASLDGITESGLINLRAADMVELNGRLFIIAGGDSSTTAGQDTISVIEVTGTFPSYTLTSVYETSGLFDSINDIEIVASQGANSTGFDVLVGQEGQGGLEVLWLGIDANSGDVSLTQGVDQVTDAETVSNTPNITSIASLDGLVLAGSDNGNATSLMSSGVYLPPNLTYCFVGESGNLFGAGTDGSGGDFDGDGYSDLLIGSGGSIVNLASGTIGGLSGSAYAISAADLHNLDLLDSNFDGQIDLSLIAGSSLSSYEFITSDLNDATGRSVRFIGDIDGDGRDDIIVGAPSSEGLNGQPNTGHAFMLASQDFQLADLADGSLDNVINFDLLNYATFSAHNSYKFVRDDLNSNGAHSERTYTGSSLSTLNDQDGDGVDELIINSAGRGFNNFLTPTGSNAVNTGGTVFLASSTDWATVDALDTVTDGEVDLNNFVGLNSGNSWVFTSNVFGDRLGEHGVDQVVDQADGDTRSEIFIGATHNDAGGTNAGTAYLIASSEYSILDALDVAGSDSLIFVDQSFASLTHSYRFFGEGAADFAGRGVLSMDNFVGTGGTDYVISAHFQDENGPSSNTGSVYIIDGGELENLDQADLSNDQDIQLGLVAANATSYQISHSDNGRQLGFSLDRVDDIDGDGRDELLVGFRYGAVLVSSADLAAADALGTPGDGKIGTDDLVQGLNANSYIFSVGNTQGNVSYAGDVDGDGIGDFFLGFPGASSGDGAGFLIRGSQLEAMDLADGTDDNFVDLNPHIGWLCFARGTLIETEAGPVAVQDLRIDDHVLTLDDGYQPVSWLGSRKISGRGNMAPICIRKGALDNTSDLYVSPQHRMLVRGHLAELYFGQDEVLATAQSLISGDMIYRAPCDEVEYFHVMFDAHQVIYANGAPSESFKPGEQGFSDMADETLKEIFHLFPELEENVDSYGLSARTELKHYEGKLLAGALF